jgi:hypothetical protein
MRIALLSDVHANREALTACLEDARANGVARYVFLGDYVGYGADPGFVVDTVQSHVLRGAIAVRGNHDDAIETGTDQMTESAALALAWTRAQLTAAQRAFLRELPLSASEADRLYVHANVDAPADWDYITDLYTASRSLIAMANAHRSVRPYSRARALPHVADRQGCELRAGRRDRNSAVAASTMARGARRRWAATRRRFGGLLRNPR